MTKDNLEKSYTVKIEGEGIDVTQLISKERARQILNIIMSTNSEELIAEIDGNTTKSSDREVLDPKMFMAMKKPMSDVERITCLAYYLSHYRGIAQYKTRELTDLNTEASQPRFSNPTVAARNAVQQQYLSLAGGGRKQITTRGEAVVNVLPDRDKVKKALDENIYRASRRRKSKKIAKKEKNE